MHLKPFIGSGENLNRESYDYVDSDPVVPVRIKSSDASGTYLAMEIIEKYVVCFDGIRKKVTVKNPNSRTA